METRPPVVWRALSVVLFVGMFGFSLVKAQGCQREAKPESVDEVLPATKSGVPFDGVPALEGTAEEQPKATAADAGQADAGKTDAGAGSDAGAKSEKILRVIPATKFGPVFPATKSGPPVRIPDPEPQQQNAPKK